MAEHDRFCNTNRLVYAVRTHHAPVLTGYLHRAVGGNDGIRKSCGVGSRFVCVAAGGVLVILGLVGKLGAVLGSIPEVIVGAVYLLVFGLW